MRLYQGEEEEEEEEEEEGENKDKESSQKVDHGEEHSPAAPVET